MAQFVRRQYGHLYQDELQNVADRLDSLHAECAQNVPTRLRVVGYMRLSGRPACRCG